MTRGTHPTDEARELRPLSVRMLARLPGPRVLWIVAWAAVPWLNAAANLLLGATNAIWERAGRSGCSTTPR